MNSSFIRPQDIKTLTTSDPKRMLGKYLTQPLYRTWFEDFRDESTGEVISIDRHEVVAPAGRITQDVLQNIVFCLQSGDITKVEVADTPYNCKRFIPYNAIPFEVTCRFDCTKAKYLVRTSSIEKAIQIVGDFAPLYLDMSGRWQVFKVESRGVIIVDEDTIDTKQRCRPEQNSYYLVTVRERWYDSFDERVRHVEHDLIVAADEIGAAKDRALAHYNEAFKDSILDHGATVSALLAKPYPINSVIPLEYTQLYND